MMPINYMIFIHCCAGDELHEVAVGPAPGGRQVEVEPAGDDWCRIE